MSLNVIQLLSAPSEYLVQAEHEGQRVAVHLTYLDKDPTTPSKSRPDLADTLTAVADAVRESVR